MILLVLGVAQRASWAQPSDFSGHWRRRRRQQRLDENAEHGERRISGGESFSLLRIPRFCAPLSPGAREMRIGAPPDKAPSPRGGFLPARGRPCAQGGGALPHSLRVFGARSRVNIRTRRAAVRWRGSKAITAGVPLSRFSARRPPLPRLVLLAWPPVRTLNPREAFSDTTVPRPL